MPKHMIFHDECQDSDTMSDVLTTVMTGEELSNKMVDNYDAFVNNLIIFTCEDYSTGYRSKPNGESWYETFIGMFLDESIKDNQFQVVEIFSSILDYEIVIIEPMK